MYFIFQQTIFSDIRNYYYYPAMKFHISTLIESKSKSLKTIFNSAFRLQYDTRSFCDQKVP